MKEMKEETERNIFAKATFFLEEMGENCLSEENMLHIKLKEEI